MAFGGLYYTNKQAQEKAQDRIEYLVQQNAAQATDIKTLKNAVATNNETINQMEREYDRIREDFHSLEGEFGLFRMYENELTQRFERHDLNALALAKPDLIENIINNASKESMRCLELLSGAPLNSKELNATNEREFNSECPWLFKN